MNWRSRPTLPFKEETGEDGLRGESDPFRRFAEAAETIRATTKRLEKSSLLGDYFASLSDDDLVRAARYFAGYSFPLFDQRTTKVGGASLFSAIVAATGADPAALRARLVPLGDLGDLAFEALGLMPNPRQAHRLTLHEIADALEELASMSGSRRKIDLVTDLLEGAAPLEAKYIVKLLSGDLRIGLKEGAVEDAIARMFQVDLAEVQWANMLTGDVGETALLARNNRLSQATVRLFHPFKFMLATAVAGPEEVARQMPVPFFVEDKFDGIRAQAHIAPATDDPNLMGMVVDGVRVALFSRTLDEITISFPDLLEALAATLTRGAGAGAGLILDGEIVPVRGERIMPFLELQRRLGRKTLSDELKASVPVSFVAYDVLFAAGEILINQPLTKRRVILDSLPLDNDRVRRSELRSHEEVSVLEEEFNGSRGRGNEGLVVKDPRSRYKSGRRGRDWLKMKRALATLDVVVTAVEVGHGRRSHLLSDYTFAVRVSEDDSSLLNIGKAYSGLTDLELAELSNWFREHTIEEFDHGRLRIVEPRIVLEVTFDGIQLSTRHASGYALRFPRILRIRRDKPADQIDTLGTVKGLI